jgi:hypothetical protein
MEKTTILKRAIFSKISIASFVLPLLSNHLGDSEIKLMKKSKMLYCKIMRVYIVLDLKLLEIYMEKTTIFLVGIGQYHSCFSIAILCTK